MQAVRHLPFCYFCGVSFPPKGERSADHVPPRAVFKVSDRENAPLVLDAHPTCNGEQSVNDALAGELLSCLHGVPLGPRSRLHAATFEWPDGTLGGVRDMNLRAIIARWVRASHTALYREHLPEGVKAKLWEPFAAFRPAPEGLRVEPLQHRQYEHAMHLKQHIHLGRVDEIHASNGKYRYVCVWQEIEGGRSICLFGLTLYGWEKMGEDVHPNVPSRSCCGWYEHPRPPNATLGTTLVVPRANFRPLHLFE